MKLSKFVLIGAAFILSLSTLAPTALADNSSATITFTDSSGSEGTNSLKLDHVPNITFPAHDFTLAKIEKNGTADTSLNVTDTRGGGGLGWHVSVKAAPFYLQDENGNTNVTLEGAEITFPSPTAINGTNISEGGSGFEPPVFGKPAENPTEITLTTNSTSHTILSANTGHGLGTWSTEWSTGGIRLVIPAGQASVGTYQSTLTWTLSDTPV